MKTRPTLKCFGRYRRRVPAPGGSADGGARRRDARRRRGTLAARQAAAPPGGGRGHRRPPTPAGAAREGPPDRESGGAAAAEHAHRDQEAEERYVFLQFSDYPAPCPNYLLKKNIYIIFLNFSFFTKCHCCFCVFRQPMYKCL